MVVKINLGTRQSQCSACFSDEDQKANGPVVWRSKLYTAHPSVSIEYMTEIIRKDTKDAFSYHFAKGTKDALLHRWGLDSSHILTTMIRKKTSRNWKSGKNNNWQMTSNRRTTSRWSSSQSAIWKRQLGHERNTRGCEKQKKALIRNRCRTCVGYAASCRGSSTVSLRTRPTWCPTWTSSTCDCVLCVASANEWTIVCCVTRASAWRHYAPTQSCCCETEESCGILHLKVSKNTLAGEKVTG